MTNTSKQVSIKDVINFCEFGKKAIIIESTLGFFLQTQEDRIKFMNEFEGRMYWRQHKKPFLCLSLAKEIGLYHFAYNNYSDLVNLDEKSALEHLFQQPINNGMFQRYIEQKATLAQMYSLKHSNPDCKYFMTALLYA